MLVISVLSCKKQSTKLPSILIISESGNISTTKQHAEFRIFDKGDSMLLSGDVKYRGGASIGHEKKSYAIEFTEKIQFAGLPSDDDWVLNASYIDKTFMRHKLGFDLFMKMNPKNVASKSTYVEVFENGVNKGLFVLMQKLSAKVVGINKKDKKALLFKEPPIFYRFEFPVFDSLNRFQQKFPKLKDRNEEAILYDFRAFLFQSNEEIFYQNICDRIDLNNIIDWYLLVHLANAGDNVKKNFYLYKVDSITPFRVAMWDFDHSFGRDGDNERNLMERPMDTKGSILFTRLRDNPYLKFNDLLIKRWVELRSANIISNNEINKMIAENHKMIAPYLLRNEKIWPYNSPGYFDDNNYYQEVALMRKFIKDRIIELDKIFCYSEN